MPTVKQQPSIFSIEICRLWCKTVRSCTARGSADAWGKNDVGRSGETRLFQVIR